MWYRFAVVAKLINNLYPDSFWVNERKENESGQIVLIPRQISYGEKMGVREWSSLLSTGPNNVNDEDRLLNFLNKRISIDDSGKKVYQSVNRSLVLLSNPVEGGFYIKEKEENESGETILIPKFIPRGKEMGAKEWKKLLQTGTQFSDQESLNNFLTSDKFKYEGRKKFYIPGVIGSPTLLSNPILGGFWVNEKKENESGEVETKPRFIAYGERMNIKDWLKLLSTHKINARDKDSLKNFLTNDKFEYIGERKFYLPNLSGQAILLRNPIPEGFYIEGVGFIEPSAQMNVSEWGRLLKTDVIKQKKKSLEEFLSDKLIRNHDGDLVYTFNPQNRSILFQNPISEGFYVGDDFISPDRKMSVGDWNKLLGTDNIVGNDRDSLRKFLSRDGKITEVDGKKIYNFWERIKYLSNPVEGGFWVGNRFVAPNEEMGIVEWIKLLNTSGNNVRSQNNLNDFLGDRRRFRTIKNRKTYIPVKRSFREGLFGERFNNYNNDGISVKSGEPIKVLTNKTNILYLDYAFKKNGKILLAVEINGNQHYGFVSFGKKLSYQDWQKGLERDILKINYCHNNNIPLLIFNHMLSLKDFKSIVEKLYENPQAYDQYIPQPVIDNNVTNTSLEFIKRQIYSHLYPVFNNLISFENEISKKNYIKDTLILISKLMGIYEGGIDKTDYVKSFDVNVDLTSNYNICLAIYNSLYPNFPLDQDEKITYSDLSSEQKIYKEKTLPIKPKTIEQNPLKV
jgi:hypothetical protein